MGRSKGSSGDMPMNVTLSLASETEASHGGHVVSGKLRISACIALQIICIAKECWVRLGPKQKIKACSLSWGTESPKLHEVAVVHEKLHVVYQLIQHTSWASCIPSVSPKASFSR
ncbi:uncharacterized protein [Euphorbia lathyris]|uniref:uncharacterized protein n=1 Tax=Euphorbia lathyris TaxID=212925 RepID=UPI0033137913